MFDDAGCEVEPAAAASAGGGDVRVLGVRVLGVRDVPWTRGPAPAPSPPQPPVMVEPPAELVALWELMDAQDGDPVPVAVVGELVVDGLGDFALVELIAQLEREASCARARQLAVVEVLSRRASMNPCWPVRVGAPNITAEEVAARLGSSRAAGRELVETARLFAGVLAPTAAALAAGDIDWGKAKIFAAVLRDVVGQVAVGVQDRVLPGAGGRTHAQLRRDLARALIVVDPADAEHRVVRATGNRRVCRPKVLPDGMAGIWAVLPGAVAGRIDTALTAAARTAKAGGDPRTTDQVRADTLAAALTGCTEPCSTGPCGAGSCNAGSCGGGCAGVRVDVTVSLATLLGVDESPGELAGYGPITAQTARRLASGGTWRRLITDPASGTVLDVGTTRYHPPGDLAEIVRARDARCLLPICEMPARRCDLDHRVPFAPDGTGGATSVENLAPLCRRDHLIKTHTRWHLDRQPDRTVVWTTPTGHQYRYRSEPPPGHEPVPETDTGWDIAPTTPPPF